MSDVAASVAVEYRVENYDEVMPDLQPLLPVHWAEMAQRRDEIPLDPDFDHYRKLNEAGLLHAYTCRLRPGPDDWRGELIGYCILILIPRHAHYRHAWAKDDTIWIHADHRNLGVGNGLFDFMEAEVHRRAGGPVVIQIETREGHPALEFLLKHRGYEPTGKLFGKRFA